MKILYSVINLISEGRGTMEQTDQALKFVVSLEKTIKRICQDRQCDLSQNEQATLKTFLRNFCEENEVKAFLYLRLFLVCQVDPKREELYDRLVRLLIKLSNTSAETEVWTLQEILDNKKNTEIDQKERDATFQIILQDSIELIKKMLQVPKFIGSTGCIKTQLGSPTAL